MSEKPDKPARNRGHFFLVDVPTFAKVCELKDPDAAAAYLILAAGTGADNRTSTWSGEAINQRTALNWRRATAAIATLEKHGFVRWLSGKGTRRPRLDLPPLETRQPMQKHVAALAERIMQGEQPVTPTDKATATVGCNLGWFARADDGGVSFLADRPMVKAYLPNALVGDETGKATGASTFVDRIRLSRDPMAFRLLVDLYSLQDLAEHGGVDREAFWKKFDRETVMATGEFQIWKFTNGGEWVRWVDAIRHHRRELTTNKKKKDESAGEDFFERVRILADAGALDWVYYLTEDDTNTSMRIYPVAVVRQGALLWEEPETVVGCYATRAAAALVGNPISISVIRHVDALTEEFMPGEFTLPVQRLARKAALVGIPRLRCRAKTANAARWRKELVEDAADWVRMFRGIIAEHGPELLADADMRLAACADFNEDFNEGSTETSTFIQRDINDPSLSGKNGFRPSDGVGEDPPTRSAWDVRQEEYKKSADEHYRATGERF